MRQSAVLLLSFIYGPFGFLVLLMGRQFCCELANFALGVGCFRGWVRPIKNRNAGATMKLGNIVGGPAFCYVNKSISKQVRRLPPHKFNTSFSDFLNTVDVCPVPFDLEIEGVNV